MLDDKSNLKTILTFSQALIAIVLLSCMGYTPSRRMLDNKSNP